MNIESNNRTYEIVITSSKNGQDINVSIDNLPSVVSCMNNAKSLAINLDLTEFEIQIIKH